MKHKNKYKLNKKISLWRQTHGKVAAATTVTGCVAVGYIMTMAFASPAPNSQTGANADKKEKPGITSYVEGDQSSPTGAPTPTPGSPEAIAAEAAKQAQAQAQAATEAGGTAGAKPTAASTPAPAAPPAATPAPFIAGPDLYNATKKDIAMQLVSSAENSSLNWRAQYAYIEDIGDGRGYTGGIIGFCSGTGDMLEVVNIYKGLKPGNGLESYIPALTSVNGTDSHAGLDPGFTGAWAAAASDPLFQQAQNTLRDNWYFNPAVSQAKADGLHALGQFIYYDAMVMHGDSGFWGIRAAARAAAKTPAQGGDQTAYLHKFLDARAAEMRTEAAHSDTSRVDTAQRVFLNNGNLNLNTPLSWHVYGDHFQIN